MEVIHFLSTDFKYVSVNNLIQTIFHYEINEFDFEPIREKRLKVVTYFETKYR